MALTLLLALLMFGMPQSSTVIQVEASSQLSFDTAFHRKIEKLTEGDLSPGVTTSINNNRPFVAISSLRSKLQSNHHCDAKLISLLALKKRDILLRCRGGGDNEEEKEDDNDDETEVEVDEDEDSEYDEEEESEDYYDDEEEDDEEEKECMISSMNTSKSSEKFVDPYFISPSLQIYATFGTILLSRKIDMYSPKVVRLLRFLFIVHLVTQQAFIFYVRIMAKLNNDRTPVHVQNPLTNMLESQLEQYQPGGGNDMVKNLASTFLKKQSTVREYDMGQAASLQGSILFNMLLMWFLHFKMQQMQPLLVTTVNGFLQLICNPLFQVYVLGRNLERPFKSPEVFKKPGSGATETQKEETLETLSADADDAVSVKDDEESDDEDGYVSSDEGMEDDQSEVNDENDGEDDDNE